MNNFCFFISNHAKQALDLDDLPEGFYDIAQTPWRAVDMFVQYTSSGWQSFKASTELHSQTDGISTMHDPHFTDGRVVGVVCSICLIVTGPDRRMIGFMSARLTNDCWWLENAVVKLDVIFHKSIQMLFNVLTELNANRMYLIVDHTTVCDPRYVFFFVNV